MKKILILILSIALFLHFFPQPEISQWYEKTKEEILDQAADATTTVNKLKSSKIYQELKDEYIGFSDAELSEIKALTETVDSVERFYKESCTSSGNGSSKFHPDNLYKVCNKIKQHINSI